VNFLAHLFLAEDHSASRVGNLLGDFVTGNPASLRPRFPPAILAGIVRHRTLDAWTDAQPSFLQLKPLVSPARRRFAGAVIDVFNDYFLARHWDRFSALPMRDFLDQCYAALIEHRSHLPPDLGDDLDERLANDWLGHYGTFDGLDDVFARMARRRPAFAVLRTSIDDLRGNLELFEQGFAGFFPSAIAKVKALGPEREGL
jgi:acyl carrier protein phosphodiesterase